MLSVLELHPVDADSFALAGHHNITCALRQVFQRSSQREPLPTLVSAELPALGNHRHIEPSKNLSLGTFLAYGKRRVGIRLGTDNHVGCRFQATEVNVVILHPLTFDRQGDMPATEGVGRVVKGYRSLAAHCTVAIHFYTGSCLSCAHTSQGGFHLLNGAVGIKLQLVNAHRAPFVVIG